MHNLISLAKRAEIEFSEEEENELRRFQRYVVWAGSYPTPKDLLESDLARVRFHFRESLNLDRVWFDRLYGAAEETLARHIENRKKAIKESEG